MVNLMMPFGRGLVDRRAWAGNEYSFCSIENHDVIVRGDMPKPAGDGVFWSWFFEIGGDSVKLVRLITREKT